MKGEIEEKKELKRKRPEERREEEMGVDERGRRGDQQEGRKRREVTISHL